jgi:hypothetical protein
VLAAPQLRPVLTPTTRLQPPPPRRRRRQRGSASPRTPPPRARRESVSPGGGGSVFTRRRHTQHRDSDTSAAAPRATRARSQPGRGARHVPVAVPAARGGPPHRRVNAGARRPTTNCSFRRRAGLAVARTGPASPTRHETIAK